MIWLAYSLWFQVISLARSLFTNCLFIFTFLWSTRGTTPNRCVLRSFITDKLDYRVYLSLSLSGPVSPFLFCYHVCHVLSYFHWLSVQYFLNMVNLLSAFPAVYEALANQPLKNKESYSFREMPETIPVRFEPYTFCFPKLMKAALVFTVICMYQHFFCPRLQISLSNLVLYCKIRLRKVLSSVMKSFPWKIFYTKFQGKNRHY